MILGVIGTRLGMNVPQAITMERLLTEVRPAAVVHNDEFGTAHEVHRIAMRMGLYITVRPSDNTSRRVFSATRYNDYKNGECGPEISAQKYLSLLVRECDAVALVPGEGEDLESMALGLAKKGCGLIYTLAPDGTVLVFSTTPAPVVPA